MSLEPVVTLSAMASDKISTVTLSTMAADSSKKLKLNQAAPVKFDTVKSLVLYKAVALADVPVLEAANAIPTKIEGPDAGHIGLRETPAMALESATIFPHKVQNDTHILLELEFSLQGVAYFVKRCQGKDQQFSPTLFKRVHLDKINWGVWHFLDDLPLHAENEKGEQLITSRWKKIE